MLVISHIFTANSIDLPGNWSNMNRSDKYKLVPLSSSDQEYKQVESNFRKTVTNLTIVKVSFVLYLLLNSIWEMKVSMQMLQIERIQNPGLYQRYAVHKQQMGNPNEKYLWHGTAPDVVPNIVANGFNRSYCGVHGMFLLTRHFYTRPSL